MTPEVDVFARLKRLELNYAEIQAIMIDIDRVKIDLDMMSERVRWLLTKALEARNA